jgi:hypothetical protein
MQNPAPTRFVNSCKLKSKPYGMVSQPRKTLVKTVVILIIAGVLFLNWLGNSPSPRRSSAMAEVGATTALSDRPSPAEKPPVVLPEAPQSFASILAALRVKLHEWRQARSSGSDDQEDQARLTREMLAMVTDENVAKLLQSLSADEMDTPFGVGALHRWMQLNPVQATDWIASRADTKPAQTLAVADDWIAQGAGLQAYISQLPDTEWKQLFLNDLSAQMSVKDPAAAINVAQQMDSGPAQTSSLQVVISNWVGVDRQTAWRWMAGVNDPSVREQLVVSAAQSYALTDPAQAAAWLLSEFNSCDDSTVRNAVLKIVKTWVAKDSDGAANWVAQFPDGDAKAAAVAIVSSYWQQTDPAAATAWMQNLSGAPASAN